MDINNTVVTASDRNYIWGVYLLICSMRKNGMQEPVAVLGVGYTEEDCRVLSSLGNVQIKNIEKNTRNLNCVKPEAMFLAKTDYISWIDCDGFFIGNCSENLIYSDPDIIHIRKRSLEENRGPCPEELLSVWQKDVGERLSPRFNTRCSSCALSLHKKQLPFVQRWDEQMKKVLPPIARGVVDKRLGAYHQTDKSVLNSLLCFAEEAPEVSEDYKLDKLDTGRFFVHCVGIPKPWVCWTPYAFRYFNEYTGLVDWAQREGLPLPGEIPPSLKSSLKMRNFLYSRFSVPLRKIRSLKNKLNFK